MTAMATLIAPKSGKSRVGRSGIKSEIATSAIPVEKRGCESSKVDFFSRLQQAVKVATATQKGLYRECIKERKFAGHAQNRRAAELEACTGNYMSSTLEEYQF